MTPIHAKTIDTFNGGKWRVMAITQPGTMQVPTKEGLVDAPFGIGDTILADERDNVVLGPLSLVGAMDLAERILDNDTRSKTHPLAMLVLATAIVAFHRPAEDAPAPPSGPQAAALTVPSPTGEAVHG